MSTSNNEGRSEDRNLPPIRVLFRDELSGPSRGSYDPSVTLARLRVTDDEDIPGHFRSSSRAHGSSLAGPGYNPSAYHPPSASHRSSYAPPFPHPQQHQGHHRHPSQIYSNALAPQPDRSQPTPVAHHPGGSRPDYYTPMARSVSHDPRSYQSHLQPSGLPAYAPQHYSTDQRYDPTDTRRYPGFSSPGMTSGHRSQDSGSSQQPFAYPSIHSHVPRPQTTVATNVNPGRPSEDDEQTPTARYHGRSSSPAPTYPVSDPISGGSSSKYDCAFCGKTFNRPSSLKIHINSHTKEKPFTCPVEGCGRSFSVLSNMRRHARVHSQAPFSTDTQGQTSAPLTAVSLSSLGTSGYQPATSSEGGSTAYQHRRASSISSSSTSSRRSRSPSFDEQKTKASRPEKRTRHHPK